jgi:hypothetical protein
VFWLSLGLAGVVGPLAGLFQQWAGVLFAGWVLGVLLSFRLEASAQGLTRRLGPLVLFLPWEKVAYARIDPLLGWGRFVIGSNPQQQISFPLFLLDESARKQLASWLQAELPQSVKIVWEKSGAPQLLVAKKWSRS